MTTIRTRQCRDTPRACTNRRQRNHRVVAGLVHAGWRAGHEPGDWGGYAAELSRRRQKDEIQ